MLIAQLDLSGKELADAGLMHAKSSSVGSPEAGARVRISPGAPDKTPCQRTILGPLSAVDHTDSLRHVASRQVADLAELKDFVEGLRGAAHQARSDGNVSLAQALEITRFEVYQAYLDELATPTARRAAQK